MNTFEDKLHASAHRLASQDNTRLYVPQNPLRQRRTYWGWVATPAAAVVGLIFGLYLHLFMAGGQEVQYVYQTDTLRIPHPVHDTLYLTQIVEREKIVAGEATEAKAEAIAPQEETDTPVCTSIQCDGINYAILASN